MLMVGIDSVVAKDFIYNETTDLDSIGTKYYFHKSNLGDEVMKLRN